MMARPFALVVVCLGLLARPASAQPPVAEAGGKNAGDPAAETRIEFLREKMAAYRIQSADGAESIYPLQDNLALRWSNPVSGVVDGGIFIWTDGRRPMAIGKCFLNEVQEAWGEVIHSVSPAPLVMTQGDREVWKPSGPGLSFHPLDGAPKPSSSAAARLTQMRSLMRRIEVVGIWGEREPTDWALRMLTTPVHRYHSEPDKILDAAVFAFTQGGTNPEAIGLVELIDSDAAPRWQVAVTRLTHYGVRAKLDDKVIADLPLNKMPAVDEPFYRGWHWFRRYPFPKQATTQAE